MSPSSDRILALVGWKGKRGAGSAEDCAYPWANRAPNVTLAYKPPWRWEPRRRGGKNAEGLLRFREKAFRNRLKNRLWERQICPEVVQVAWRSAGGGIEALSTEHPDVAISVRLPDGDSAARQRCCSHTVCHW